MDYSKHYMLNEESRITDEFQCECCRAIIDGFEAIDPFIIDGRVFCLTCASDLTTLRMHEYIQGVSSKTKKLKNHCVQCNKSDSSVWFSKPHNEWVCDECHDALP